MRVLLLTALLFASTSWAKDQSSLTITTKNGVYNFHLKENVWISKNCLQVDCLAMRKVKNEELKEDGVFTGHPAATFCEEKGGQYIVGSRKEGDQDGLCEFKDKSFILGWDFYERNKKAKK